jgi:hypothetical protein
MSLISHWTLLFTNAEMELRYQRKKSRTQSLPCLGQILFWVTLAGSVARRGQLLLDAYYGSQMYNKEGELRLTLIYYCGLVVEGIVNFIPALCKGRGVSYIAFSMWHLVDSSVFYSPKEFTFVASYRARENRVGRSS